MHLFNSESYDEGFTASARVKIGKLFVAALDKNGLDVSAVLDNGGAN